MTIHLKPWKYPPGYFFSKIKSPTTFYTRDDIYDYKGPVHLAEQQFNSCYCLFILWMSFRYYHRPLKGRCVSALGRFKPQFTVVLSNITSWCCIYLFNDDISMIDYGNFVDFGHLWQFRLSPSSWDKGEITHPKGHWRTRPIANSAYNKLGPSQTRPMIIYILK